MELVQVFSIGKDSILASCAIATTFLAYRTVNKWRSEFKTKAYFEMSKNLMLSIYSFRNTFNAVGSVWIDASEFPAEYIKNKGVKSFNAIYESEAHSFVYKNRLLPFTEVFSKLDLALLEAEALWPDLIGEQKGVANRIYNRLVFSIKNYLRYMSAARDAVDHEERFSKDFEDLRGELDLFVKSFEDMTRAHLLR